MRKREVGRWEMEVGGRGLGKSCFEIKSLFFLNVFFLNVINV